MSIPRCSVCGDYGQLGKLYDTDGEVMWVHPTCLSKEHGGMNEQFQGAGGRVQLAVTETKNVRLCSRRSGGSLHGLRSTLPNLRRELQGRGKATGKGKGVQRP